eukprot:Selendium_serpulae@DN4763_c0_g1_i2.p1
MDSVRQSHGLPTSHVASKLRHVYLNFLRVSAASSRQSVGVSVAAVAAGVDRGRVRRAARLASVDDARRRAAAGLPQSHAVRGGDRNRAIGVAAAGSPHCATGLLARRRRRGRRSALLALGRAAVRRADDAAAAVGAARCREPLPGRRRLHRSTRAVPPRCGVSAGAAERRHDALLAARRRLRPLRLPLADAPRRRTAARRGEWAADAAASESGRRFVRRTGQSAVGDGAARRPLRRAAVAQLDAVPLKRELTTKQRRTDGPPAGRRR